MLEKSQIENILILQKEINTKSLSDESDTFIIFKNLNEINIKSISIIKELKHQNEELKNNLNESNQELINLSNLLKKSNISDIPINEKYDFFDFLLKEYNKLISFLLEEICNFSINKKDLEYLDNIPNKIIKENNIKNCNIIYNQGKTRILDIINNSINYFKYNKNKTILKEKNNNKIKNENNNISDKLDKLENKVNLMNINETKLKIKLKESNNEINEILKNNTIQNKINDLFYNELNKIINSNDINLLNKNNLLFSESLKIILNDKEDKNKLIYLSNNINKLKIDNIQNQNIDQIIILKNENNNLNLNINNYEKEIKNYKNKLLNLYNLENENKIIKINLIKKEKEVINLNEKIESMICIYKNNLGKIDAKNIKINELKKEKELDSSFYTTNNSNKYYILENKINDLEKNLIFLENENKKIQFKNNSKIDKISSLEIELKNEIIKKLKWKNKFNHFIKKKNLFILLNKIKNNFIKIKNDFIIFKKEIEDIIKQYNNYNLNKKDICSYISKIKIFLKSYNFKLINSNYNKSLDSIIQKYSLPYDIFESFIEKNNIDNYIFINEDNKCLDQMITFKLSINNLAMLICDQNKIDNLLKDIYNKLQLQNDNKYNRIISKIKDLALLSPINEINGYMENFNLFEKSIIDLLNEKYNEKIKDSKFYITQMETLLNRRTDNLKIIKEEILNIK